MRRVILICCFAFGAVAFAQPSPPDSRVIVSWTDAIMLLCSSNLTDWTTSNVIATRTVVLPQSDHQFFRVPIIPERVSVSWDESPSEGIAGYNIYSGSVSRVYTNMIDVGTNLFCVLQVTPGLTTFYSVTVYSDDGLESDYSNEVNYTAPILEPSPARVLVQ